MIRPLERILSIFCSIEIVTSLSLIGVLFEAGMLVFLGTVTFSVFNNYSANRLQQKQSLLQLFFDVTCATIAILHLTFFFPKQFADADVDDDDFFFLLVSWQPK